MLLRLFHKTRAATSTITASTSQRIARTPVPMTAASMEPKSCVKGRVMPVLSSRPTRNSDSTPRSVICAAKPATSKVTSAFKLPLPALTRLRCGQPEPSTMPKPNNVPPTLYDSQRKRLLQAMVLLASSSCSSIKPSVPEAATATASTHIISRAVPP